MATVTLEYTYIWPYPTKTVQVETGPTLRDTIDAAVKALHGPDRAFDRNHSGPRDPDMICGWITYPERDRRTDYHGQQHRVLGAYVRVIVD